MFKTSALTQPRYAARFVNGANVVVDLHNKTHSMPYGRRGDAERAAVHLNQRSAAKQASR